MNPWNPEIRIMRDPARGNQNPWRVQLSGGSVYATHGGDYTPQARQTDVDQFCCELSRAVETAHQLNLAGDAT